MKERFTEEEFTSACSRDKLKLECYECLVTFERTKSQVQEARSPSSKYKGKYCSKSCSVATTNRGQRRHLGDRKECPQCLIPIPQASKHCSKECRRKTVLKKRAVIIEKDEHLPWADNTCRRHVKEYLIHRDGHRCSRCKTEVWMNEPVPLTCDHIDGNPERHVLSNFRLLCANCDRQMPTFGARNKGKGRKSRRKKTT